VKVTLCLSSSTFVGCFFIIWLITKCSPRKYLSHLGQGHKTRGGQSDNRRNNQKRDYKDLDDPKEVNVKVTNSRVQINYDDI